jgi:hypothetical protein
MLARHPEPEKESKMDIATQMERQHDPEFNATGDGRERHSSHDSNGRHPHHHSFHHGDQDRWEEVSHHDIHGQGPAEHGQFDHGGGLGWGPAAWGEAGGFEHVLGGGLTGPAGVDPIDHFGGSSGFATLNHVSETVNIIFEVGAGGTIEVGGNVEALANQMTALGAPGSGHGGDLLHNVQFETTNIIFNAANGGTIEVGGNVESLGSQSSSLTGGQSHDFASFLHNAQVETTNIIFNAANGGAIEVGGNVEALSSQQSHIDSHVGSVAHLA